MRFPTVVLITTLAVLAFAGSAAAEAKTFTVTAHDGNGKFWFEVEGLEGENPTIPVAPGDEVTIEFTNEGAAGHNFHVMGSVDQSTAVIGSGESETLTFTVPEDATEITYQCDPHVSLNMAGKFSTQSTETGSGSGGETEPPAKESPGFGLPLLVAGLAAALLVVRRKA